MCWCISAYSLMPYLPCHYLYISFIYCTCWEPTISVLKLDIFLCYSNLLLRRRRWTGILRWGVLGYVLSRLPFLWCYGVFHCSISLRVVLVFKDIIYVIIILYIRDIWLSVDTFGHMCGTIDPGSCIRWVLGIGIKIRYDKAWQHDTRGLGGHHEWLQFTSWSKSWAGTYLALVPSSTRMPRRTHRGWPDTILYNIHMEVRYHPARQHTKLLRLQDTKKSRIHQYIIKLAHRGQMIGP
jgi:hypothetical protein